MGDRTIKDGGFTMKNWEFNEKNWDFLHDWNGIPWDIMGYHGNIFYSSWVLLRYRQLTMVFFYGDSTGVRPLKPSFQVVSLHHPFQTRGKVMSNPASSGRISVQCVCFNSPKQSQKCLKPTAPRAPCKTLVPRSNTTGLEMTCQWD